MPTITGTVKDEAENLYIGAVQFENLDAPVSGGSFVVGPALTEVPTDSNGSLPAGFRLAPGRTRIIINGRKSKTFTVPTGSGTYDLSTLMAAASALNTRIIIQAETLADLRAYPSLSTNFKADVLAVDDGTGSVAYAVFKWATSSEADDGVRYVRPSDYSTAGLGKLWVRIF